MNISSNSGITIDDDSVNKNSKRPKKFIIVKKEAREDVMNTKFDDTVGIPASKIFNP